MQIFWDFRDVFFYLCFLFLTSDVYLSLHPFSLQREMSEVEIKITQEKDVTIFLSSQVPVFFFHLYFSFAK